MAAQTLARSPRADARRNRGNLLAVAKEAFAVEGTSASLRDIARRADVGIGTLYRHFPTREALLEAVLREGLETLRLAADELLASPDPGAALVEWLRRFSDTPGACRGLPDTLLTALHDENSELHSSCVAMRGAAGRLLARAQEAGEMRGDVEPEDLFVSAAAIRWVAEWADRERAERILAMLSSGFLVHH